MNRKILIGDEVKVLSNEGRHGKVVEVLNNGSSHKDVLVQYDDGSTEEVSYGEIERIN